MRAFVMVGAPGAGKSTYAAKLSKIEEAKIISGDDIREDLYGSANTQGNWVEIWDRIEEEVELCAGDNKNVILDGTHYTSTYREEAIAMLKSYGYNQIEAIVIDTSLDNCIFRNASRHRGVPRHTLIEMNKKLQSSLKTIDNEGFSHINYIF
jgi:predicted kinase